MRTLESILNDEVMDPSDKVKLSKLILNSSMSELLGVRNTALDSVNDRYIFGKVDETISRIDKKLEDLCKELKELNTILEKYNER
jgi:hypothetical protein